MNKQGKASLTWVLIAIAVFATMVSLSYNSYNQFMTDNNQTIDSSYTNYYGNITDTYSDVEGINTESKGLWSSVWGGIASGAQIFITGLGAIGKMFEIITIAPKITNAINEAVPGLGTLLNLLTLVISIWVIFKLIQAYRGTGTEA